MLVNKHDYRYLQDYGLGPETPLGQPQNKQMELGPRDKLSQAFWHQQQAGCTDDYHGHAVVYLDLRHLSRAHLQQRLPFICELAQAYVNVDPAKALIPIRPAVHYTMGGITTDINCQTSLQGLYAVGECASIGLHGANRLGSNSLSELLVFGRVAGEQAAQHARSSVAGPSDSIMLSHYQATQLRLQRCFGINKDDSVARLRQAMTLAMEQGCGIYRDAKGLTQCQQQLQALQARYQALKVSDSSKVFNSELAQYFELGFSLDVAETICSAALARTESRGAHQRLDSGMTARNDTDFLCHSLVHYQAANLPKLSWHSVTLTSLPPAERLYGAGSTAENKP